MLKIMFAVLVSFNVWAQSNHSTDNNRACAAAYRVATTDLLSVIKDFQEGRFTSAETAGFVTTISGQAKIFRGTCLLIESPQARACSDRYKEVYQDVSKRVSAGALLTGNQKEIDAGFLFVKGIEVKLALIDARCL